MTLREKQSLFVRMVALLIGKANDLGYDLTFGDAYRDKRCGYGHANSLHGKRLAIDLNLFIDGVYQMGSTGHDELHEYWEAIGGAPAIGGDSNHYSLEHEGMK